MVLKVYSVFDTKANCFNAPFFVSNDNLAKRNFVTLRDDPLSTVNKFPDDFQLFDLGSYDDLTGLIVSNSVPIRLEV